MVPSTGGLGGNDQFNTASGFGTSGPSGQHGGFGQGFDASAPSFGGSPHGQDGWDAGQTAPAFGYDGPQSSPSTSKKERRKDRHSKDDGQFADTNNAFSTAPLDGGGGFGDYEKRSSPKRSDGRDRGEGYGGACTRCDVHDCHAGKACHAAISFAFYLLFFWKYAPHHRHHCRRMIRCPSLKKSYLMNFRFLSNIPQILAVYERCSNFSIFSCP